MTNFSLLLGLAGLSTDEAAAFLKSSPVHVCEWSRGDHIAPADALEKIRDLIANQAEAAAEALDFIQQHRPKQVELRYPPYDNEARSIGWPCMAAWKAMATRFAPNVQRQSILYPSAQHLQRPPQPLPAN